MSMHPVEWILVVYYGPEAHRAAYGRQVRSNRYTKDYIQLSRRKDFIETLSNVFSSSDNDSPSIPLMFRWPSGKTSGAIILQSSDRPHLKWETSLGAPQVWKMSLAPNEETAETIPGDPSCIDFESAEHQLELIAERGGGQPYLMAIKLKHETDILHLRVYLKEPADAYSFANIDLLPKKIRDISEKTSRTSALAWSVFDSDGAVLQEEIRSLIRELKFSQEHESIINELDPKIGSLLLEYLNCPGYGVFFDPEKNHDAWLDLEGFSEEDRAIFQQIIEALLARFPDLALGDFAAEMSVSSLEEIEEFRSRVENKNYEIADAFSTTKTRGSAQKVFADAVKGNYGYRCAITDIETKDFLVASHIVPWSEDQSIRLDPSNGICLSLLVDKAFEKGYLTIDDELRVRIDNEKVGEDRALREQLEAYDGRKLNAPSQGAPNLEYLRRRRELNS